MSGQKARVLVQRHDLAPFGFACGAPITVSYQSDRIVVTATPDGDRKVSCVTDKRRNKEYQVLDLRFSDEQRQEMFKGVDKLNVSIGSGLIVITAGE